MTPAKEGVLHALCKTGNLSHVGPWGSSASRCGEASAKSQREKPKSALFSETPQTLNPNSAVPDQKHSHGAPHVMHTPEGHSPLAFLLPAGFQHCSGLGSLSETSEFNRSRKLKEKKPESLRLPTVLTLCRIFLNHVFDSEGSWETQILQGFGKI